MRQEQLRLFHIRWFEKKLHAFRQLQAQRGDRALNKQQNTLQQIRRVQNAVYARERKTDQREKPAFSHGEYREKQQRKSNRRPNERCGRQIELVACNQAKQKPEHSKQKHRELLKQPQR